jgi:GTP-binding protein Era
VIALNKVDLLDPGEIGTQITKAAALGDFHALHPVSAKTGDGVDALRKELVGLLPEGPPLFPPGEMTDLPLDVQIGELVREKALELTREEVPHSLTVEVDELTTGRVQASILVETPSQKRILVGKGGGMIKEIGTRARPEIELLLGRPVYLDLRVKVKEKWRRNEALLERLGI